MASYRQTDTGLELISRIDSDLQARESYLGTAVLMRQPEGQRTTGDLVVYYQTMEGDPAEPVDNDVTIPVVDGKATVDPDLQGVLEALGWTVDVPE